MGQSVFLPPTPVPPRRFTRRTWTMLILLVLFQAGLVLAIVYLVNRAERQLQEENAEADRRLQEAMAEADRLDPHWRLEELEARRAVLADKDNAALVVQAAKKLIPRNWPFWDFAILEQNPEDEANRLLLQESLAQLTPAEQLNERQTTALRQELERARRALAAARRLASLPNGRFRITYGPDFSSTLLPHLQDVREVASLLAYDVLLRAQDRDVGGALTSCRAVLNTGRALGDEPVFVSQMVRAICQTLAVSRIERVLAQGQAEGASLSGLQKLLEKEQAAPLFLIGARGERAGLDHSMQRLEVSGPEKIAKAIQGLKGGGKDGGDENRPRHSPMDVKRQRAALLRYMNQEVEVAKLPLAQQRRRLARLEAGARQQPDLVRQLAPAMVRVAQAIQRSQAQLRCGGAALALERFRLAHQGRWPDSLATLVPEYLEKVPTDPFDGAPLRFRRTGAGVVVYSVGPDGKDDGGKIDRDRPDGPGTDVGFRLWDRAKRRQPANPFPVNLGGPPNRFPPRAARPFPGGDG